MLLELGNEPLSGATKVGFAASTFKGSAVVRWDSVIESSEKNEAVANNWETVKQTLRNEIFPQHSQRRARDRLRKLYQSRSVSGYLDE